MIPTRVGPHEAIAIAGCRGGHPHVRGNLDDGLPQSGDRTHNPVLGSVGHGDAPSSEGCSSGYTTHPIRS
jgi:hypothetical protein